MHYFAALFAGLPLVAALPQMESMPGMNMDGSAGTAPAASGGTGMTLEIPTGTQFERSINMTALTPGGTVVKKRYGPYIMGPMAMRENQLTLNAEKPCTGCYVVAMQAGLEDEAGQEINIDTGKPLESLGMLQVLISRVRCLASSHGYRFERKAEGHCLSPRAHAYFCLWQRAHARSHEQQAQVRHPYGGIGQDGYRV